MRVSASFRQKLEQIEEKSAIARGILRYSDKFNAKIGDYLDYHDGKLSYLPSGKPLTMNPYTAPGRVAGKPARLLQKMIVKGPWDRPIEIYNYHNGHYNKYYEFTNEDFEQFVNYLKSFDLQENLSYELVRGEDIRYWYHESRYAPSSFMLNQSCMRYDHCQRYLDIYTENTNCELLIAVDAAGNLHGRTLVWTLNGGQKRFDRIYGNDAVCVSISDWCTNNNIPRKISNPETVTLEKSNFDEYPYMDSLPYLDRECGILATTPGTGRFLCARSTEGGYESLSQCPRCGTADHDENMRYGYDEYVCYSCFENNRCERCGEYHEEDGDYCANCQEKICPTCNRMREYNYSTGAYECGQCVTQEEEAAA